MANNRRSGDDSNNLFGGIIQSIFRENPKLSKKKQASAALQTPKNVQQENEIRQQEEDAMWASYREDERRRQEQITWDEYQGVTDDTDEAEPEDDAEYIDGIYTEQDVDVEDEAPQDSVIDNTELTYTDCNHPVCIRLNDKNERRNHLKLSGEVLRDKFEVELLDDEDGLERIVSEVFPDGFQKTLYIRNLSFDSEDGNEVKVLGIRPEIYPGDFLSELFPKGVSLLFKGHLRGREFLVDSIFDVSDTECLDYEVECTVVQYDNPEMIRYNFLYDVLAQAQSIVRYTSQKLTEWKEYLNWKKELAKRQIYGCKYFNVTVDESKKRLIFWLVCESKEYFLAFRKYLNRDIRAFSNDYSSDKWIFKLAEGEARDKRRRYAQGSELGRYRGVVKEYYLTDGESDPEREASAEEPYADVYDEYEYYDERRVSGAIETQFENPYIVQVAFELPREDADAILAKDLHDEDITQYIIDRVIPGYEATGFLALSAVGEFVLIDRFQKAISQLERDESYSPNLAAWLFNVGQARLPDEDNDITVDSWLNPKVEKNENQRTAVLKMLKAPDLCLIQGPPGTGKTTVIAEAIYQFVRQGQRVLIASQSNDAVDNALDRLINSPKIRAIRLGQKGRRRRRNEDFSGGRFSEESALGYYYSALSSRISDAWLTPWSRLEEQIQSCNLDIRDARLYNEDISELNSQHTKINAGLSGERKNWDRIKRELSAANEQNSSIENERYQFSIFESFARGDSSEPFYLSEGQLKAAEGALYGIITFAHTRGISLAPSELSTGLFDPGNINRQLMLIQRRISILENLLQKVAQTQGKREDDDPELQLLMLQMSEIKEQLIKAIDNEDEERITELRKERLRINRAIELKKIGGFSTVEITEAEKQFISAELLGALTGSEKVRAAETLTAVVNIWCQKLEQAVQDISEYMAGRTKIDTDLLTEECRASEGRISIFKAEFEKISKQIELKRGTLAALSEKYKVDSTDVEHIIRHIEAVRADAQSQLERSQEFRSEWEETLKRFKARLDEPDAAAYDRENYQQIYIDACNVVGISCTDNMRNLDETFKGFDVVMIDEVSKATPPELLIPLMKARKAVLVGDHRQLPPMFKEHEKSYKELMQQQENTNEDQEDELQEIRSLLTPDNFRRFKTMVTASLFKDFFEQADDSIKHSLLTQYRMHSDIMNVINRFYDNRLTSGLRREEEDKEKSHGMLIKGVDGTTLIRPQHHAYWLDSSALPSGKAVYESYLSNSTSACNFLEMHMIIELLKKMAEACRKEYEKTGNQKTVGVISFYQMQVNELRSTLREERRRYDFSPLSVDINTVDRFQGKEKNIIITSLVRNNKGARASEHVVAFERINVAFSRAQELLVIVGSKHMYENQLVELPNMDSTGSKPVHIYRNIIEDLHRKACFRGSEKLITSELENLILEKCKESGEKH